MGSKLIAVLALVAACFGQTQRPTLPQGLPAQGYAHDPIISDIAFPNYYLGKYAGGLWGNWSNQPPASHLARLNAAATTILAANPFVVVDYGHSRTMNFASAQNYPANAWNPFDPQQASVGTFLNYLGFNPNNPKSGAPNLNPNMAWFDCAVGGQETNRWSSNDAGFYTFCDNFYLGRTWQKGDAAVGTSGENPAIWNTRYACGEQIIFSGHVEQVTSVQGSACPTSQLGFPGNGATPAFSTSGGTVTDNQIIWTDEGTSNLPATYTTSQVYVFYARTIPTYIQEAFGTNGNCAGTVSGNNVFTFTSANCTWSHGGNDSWDDFPAQIAGINVLLTGWSISGANGVFNFTSLGSTVANGAQNLVVQPYNNTMQLCPAAEVVFGSPSCEYYVFKWWIGRGARYMRSHFPNLQLSIFSADYYSGNCMTANCKRSEPGDAEGWFAVRDAVLDQCSQSDSEVAVTTSAASGVGGTATLNVSSFPSQQNAQCPFSWSGTVTVQVTGNSDATYNTTCTVNSCVGVSATVSGNTVIYSCPLCDGAAGSGGHVSIISHPLTTGGLETADSTAAVMAIGPYDWAPGDAIGGAIARSDGWKEPCQFYQSDNVHPSLHGAAEYTGCSAGLDHAWFVANNSAQDYISKLWISFWTGYTTQDGASGNANLGNSPYAFGPNLSYVQWMCASGHRTAGCV